LGSRGLFPLWSQVRVQWLLIWWPLEIYMVVNFRACKIRGARKLVRTHTLKKKKFNQVSKPSAFKNEWSPLENGMTMNKWVLANQIQINKNDLMSFVGPFVFWSTCISILGQTPTPLLIFSHYLSSIFTAYLLSWYDWLHF
jgi:hypothetical protein